MNDLAPVITVSPLRQRLIDDMMMRRFSRETQRNYIRDVGRLAAFLGRLPDTATAEDLRRFQIEKHDAGVPVPTMNSIVSALRVFFTHTLDRPDLSRKLVRVCHEIRKYMALVDGDEPMGGPFQIVEIDETFMGGVKQGAQGGKGKTIVLGIRQREGDIVTRVVPDRKAHSLIGHITEVVKAHTEIHTDELHSYKEVRMWNGYRHKTVNHSAKEYVGKGGVTVNGLEGYWSQLKRSINGTHIHVSAKHLPKYLGEFEFRHNRPETMLGELMMSFQR